MAFTVPIVPTGMKAGVWITPLLSSSRPVRALPSFLTTEKIMLHYGRYFIGRTTLFLIRACQYDAESANRKKGSGVSSTYEIHKIPGLVV